MRMDKEAEVERNLNNFPKVTVWFTGDLEADTCNPLRVRKHGCIIGSEAMCAFFFFYSIL